MRNCVKICRYSVLTLISALVLASVSTPARADVIIVEPGAQILTDALARATKGDTVRLKAGRYEGSFNIPAGVIVEGEESDAAVTIIGTDYAIFKLAGPEITIRNLHFKGAEKVRRGINTDSSVRIENCRFESVPEAIALMTAPLSDVINCHFKDCGISVRAIGEASPTVWGCRFEGGRIGVFAMGGAPYIQNNLFQGLETGIMLIADSLHTRVFRNNVFMDCTKAGIDLPGDDSSFACASIRNSVFVRCPIPIAGPRALLEGVSHCAFEESPLAELDLTERKCISAPLDLTINDDGSLNFQAAELLAGKGIRLGSEPQGTTHRIGFTTGFNRPGLRANPAPASPVPPIRFSAKPILVNATTEEYQYLALNRLRMSRQSLHARDGKHFDIMNVTNSAGNELEIEFDIDRFFGDSAYLKP